MFLKKSLKWSLNLIKWGMKSFLIVGFFVLALGFYVLIHPPQMLFDLVLRQAEKEIKKSVGMVLQVEQIDGYHFSLEEQTLQLKNLKLYGYLKAKTPSELARKIIKAYSK